MAPYAIRGKPPGPKQMALFPYSGLLALKTPPVKFSTSTPVKVFVSPVLPPTEKNSGDSIPMARESSARYGIV
jgi:hypothetical protein